MYKYQIKKADGTYYIFFYRKGMSIGSIDIPEDRVFDIVGISWNQEKRSLNIQTYFEDIVVHIGLSINHDEILKLIKQAINEIVQIEQLAKVMEEHLDEFMEDLEV
ncbi:MAG: hypothetical protein GXY77_17260 [Fibrobacter sp.]|nr:hypothetical protein [Fibrobacter sp.]